MFCSWVLADRIIVTCDRGKNDILLDALLVRDRDETESSSSMRVSFVPCSSAHAKHACFFPRFSTR